MNLTFGEKIKEARKAKKLTQKQLANKIGAAHNSISDWENNKNKPDPDTIELLCGVLDISPNYLLTTAHDDFSPSEKLLIKKYRELDKRGKELVDSVLEQAYESRPRFVDGQISLLPVNGYMQIFRNGRWENYKKIDDECHNTNAAHNDEESTPEERKAGDDIMTDDSEWE